MKGFSELYQNLNSGVKRLLTVLNLLLIIYCLLSTSGELSKLYNPVGNASFKPTLVEVAEVCFTYAVLPTIFYWLIVYIVLWVKDGFQPKNPNLH